MEQETTRRKESRAFADLVGIADASSIMPEIFQLPAECARVSMQLMQNQLTAYSEFAQRCAKCQKPEEFMEEYAHFCEQMMADYSNYVIGVANSFAAFERATSRRLGSNLAA